MCSSLIESSTDRPRRVSVCIVAMFSLSVPGCGGWAKFCELDSLGVDLAYVGEPLGFFELPLRSPALCVFYSYISSWHILMPSLLHRMFVYISTLVLASILGSILFAVYSMCDRKLGSSISYSFIIRLESRISN